jgi:hypothetical protein
MKTLAQMNDIERARCSKCDYMNNDVPISKKKANCPGIDNWLNCNCYMTASRAMQAVQYARGEIGPVYFNLGNGVGYIDTYDD